MLTNRLKHGAHLDWLPPEDYEALRALHHEPRKLVAQYPLNFVCLFDLDAYPYRVDGRLDEDALILVS